MKARRPHLAEIAALAAAVVLAAIGSASASASSSTAGSAVVSLRWGAVSGASQYDLQIATDEAFVAIVLEVKTNAPRYRWAWLPTRRLYWRVRSENATGAPSPWSEPRTIAPVTLPIALLSPADGARVVPTTPSGAIALGFAPLAPAERYVLELSREETFARARRVETTRASVHVALAPGRWFWRVRGRDAQGNELAISPVRAVTIVRPVPVAPSPAPILAVASPTPTPTPAPPAPIALRAPAPRARVGFRGVLRPVALSWDAITGAARYTVVLSSNETPSIAARTVAAGTATTLSVTVPPGTTFWGVRASDANGAEVARSELRELTVEPLPGLSAPTLLAPEPGQRVKSGDLALRWTSVADAARYEVTLEGERSVVRRTGETRLAALEIPAGAWNIRVRALDEHDVAGPWSRVRPFRLRPRRLPPRIEIGAAAGVFDDLAGARAPEISGEARIRTGILEDRLLVSARAGWASLSAMIPGEGPVPSARARADVFPAALVGMIEKCGMLRPYVGAGIAVRVARVGVDEDERVEAGIGPVAVAGLALAGRHASLFVEGSLDRTRLPAGPVSFGAAGAQVSVGVRWKP